MKLVISFFLFMCIPFILNVLVYLNIKEEYKRNFSVILKGAALSKDHLTKRGIVFKNLAITYIVLLIILIMFFGKYLF